MRRTLTAMMVCMTVFGWNRGVAYGVCGNGTVEAAESEECDPGGTCVGSTNAGTACTSDSECTGGGVCKTFGGHAIEGDSEHTCAANCTFETDIPFNLVPGVTAGTDIMAGTSGVALNSSALGIPIPLPLGSACDGGSNDHLSCAVDSECPGGTCAPPRQILTIGKMRNGQIPAVVKAASVKYPGIPVLSFACGCVHGAAAKSCGGTFYEADGTTLSKDCTPGFTDGDVVCTNAGKLPCAFVHGEGNTASGVIGCSGLDGVNLSYEQDSGGSSGPCAEPNTCPATVTLSGHGGPGSAVVYETLGITAALNSCTGTDPTVYGPDGIFCTEDDPVGGLVAVDGTLPAVTGTATAVVHNSGGFDGNDLGPVVVMGAEFSCTALAQQCSAGGAGIVGAFTFVHVQQVGDVAVTAQLFAQANTQGCGACSVQCPGDCDGNGTVGVDEVITMVNAALGDPAATCTNGDANCDGQITVEELVAATGNALNGCSGTSPTPTPTP